MVLHVFALDSLEPEINTVALAKSGPILQSWQTLQSGYGSNRSINGMNGFPFNWCWLNLFNDFCLQKVSHSFLEFWYLSFLGNSLWRPYRRARRSEVQKRSTTSCSRGAGAAAWTRESASSRKIKSIGSCEHGEHGEHGDRSDIRSDIWPAI